ncbi:MAG: 2-oxo acid dehydrogenase subunit E2, partial [Pseudomonadota bacterium]|nr:2-oxo acid dehydrogenase subunit E2 [Pseudomonadota bacterium]
MPIQLKMPALSPTMEEGTLANWLVKVGDTVSAGDIMAEIETDKATMEFEAVDEGTIAKILVDEGSENVKVGEVIAILAEEGEDVDAVGSAETQSGPAKDTDGAGESAPAAAPEPTQALTPVPSPAQTSTPTSSKGGRVKASPLAKRIAQQQGLDLGSVNGTGPGGRIVKADVEGLDASAQSKAAPQTAQSPAPAAKAPEHGAPFEEEKVSSVRKVIARRLTESKQTVPHYYLTMDIRLDALLALRKELNASLEADGVKLSVNDLLIKALARALMRVPQCNVSYHGDVMHRYSRADISVAVAAPSGLITPVITEADTKGLAAISKEMKELAGKARDGKLMPHEYQGGTASLSNLG